MTPTLARFIRSAQNRVRGRVMSERELADSQHQEEIEHFKMVLNRKLQIGVKLELFFHTAWIWAPDGCALQFTVDEQIFVLKQMGKDCELSRKVRGKQEFLAVLLDNEQFEDHLLVAIGDVLGQAEPPATS